MLGAELGKHTFSKFLYNDYCHCTLQNSHEFTFCVPYTLETELIGTRKGNLDDVKKERMEWKEGPEMNINKKSGEWEAYNFSNLMLGVFVSCMWLYFL